MSKKICRISFYIVAHADDWQLFMYPNPYNDIKASDAKVVFIITTAGDAGMEENYWQAREEGSKSSLRFCLAGLALQQSEGQRKFKGHTIQYCSINNAAFYFLRLPDGNIDGKGFSAYNFQSLSKFKSGQIYSITAVDNSTAYSNWIDFSSTLENIILTESKGIDEKSVHYINPDIKININDHADHIATGQAIQSINTLKNFTQFLYEGYNAGNTENKLSDKDVFWKSGMFTTYDKAVLDKSGYSTLGEGVNIYSNWCSSNAKFIIIEQMQYNDKNQTS